VSIGIEGLLALAENDPTAPNAVPGRLGPTTTFGVGSFQSQSQCAAAARGFACALGSIELDIRRLAPPVGSVTPRVLLGEFCRSLQCVGDPEVQRRELRSPA
jgi:hypothetical protein